jgi:hypothetical protein
MPDRPVRIQLSRAKGWRMPPNTVYVGRPTIWGNPFGKAAAIESGYADETNWRAFVVECFRDWLGPLRPHRDWWQGPESEKRKTEILARLPELRGKNLACWCGIGCACHADVLLELANEGAP